MRHERTWAPLRKKPDLAGKVERVILGWTAFYLLAHIGLAALNAF